MSRFFGMPAFVALILMSFVASSLLAQDVVAVPASSFAPKCYSMNLATASDKDGTLSIITVRDSVHGQNIELAHGEQPSLDSSYEKYAAVNNGDVYIGSTLYPEITHPVTTDGDVFLDEDPAISGVYVSFVRDGELMLHVEGQGFRPVVDNDGEAILVGRANIVWSPTALEFAYTSADDRALYIYDVMSGTHHFMGEFQGINSLDWGPEMIALSVEMGEYDSSIVMLSPDPDAKIKMAMIDHVGQQDDPAYNSRGDLVFTSWAEDGLSAGLIIDFAHEEQLMFVDLPGLTLQQPTWSCGEFVLFQANPNTDGDLSDYDLEIYSFNVMSGTLIWESEATSAADRVQFGPVSGSNGNTMLERFSVPWYVESGRG